MLRTAVVSTTTGSCGSANVGGGSSYIIDSTIVDTSLSGMGWYRRAWFKVNGAEFRVGSFNVASGALINMQPLGTAVASGAAYELHEMLPPSDLDRCLDWTVRRLRVRQEVAIASVDGLTVYSLDGAASPNLISDVLNVYYFADPTNSLDRKRNDIDQFSAVTTMSGTRELRISPRLAVSQQLVIDALLSPSLGAADTATAWFPDDRWVLEGAAAKAFDMLIQRGPPEEVAQYRERRMEHARNFTALSGDYQPLVERAPKSFLDEPWGW